MPAAKSGDRAAYFPAIERKYGQPMAYWFELMAELKDLKYPEQAAYLKENFGFTQTHANALIMYSRGSTSSRRFTSLEGYLATVDDVQRETISAIYAAIAKALPRSEVVIAWNKPMVKVDGKYVFGVMALKNYILIAPFDGRVLAEMGPRLAKYTVNKKTVQVPSDWKVDRKLIVDMVKLAVALGKD
jgi:uncharacterized protein YdhG (YjbR/CyaY superfamily)